MNPDISDEVVSFCQSGIAGYIKGNLNRVTFLAEFIFQLYFDRMTFFNVFSFHFIETDLLLYPTFRKENYKAQLSARDSVFVELLEGIPFENESPDQRHSIFQILSDLWLSRLNIDTVFTPTFNETINISRFGCPHILDPVFEFDVLQTLLRIVIVSYNQSRIDCDWCREASIIVVLSGFDDIYGESVCEPIPSRTDEKSALFGRKLKGIRV